MMYSNYHWGGSFSPWGMMGFFFGLGFLGMILVVIALALKGYALWHAARRNEVGWFVALLILNTMGILELIYLYFIVKKWNKPARHEHHEHHNHEHHNHS